MKRLLVPVLAYAVPTFVLGFVWHLILFERYYADLAMYRALTVLAFAASKRGRPMRNEGGLRP